MLHKHYSHIIIVVMLAASFGAVRVSAQTEEANADNSLKEGAWALQFQISGNFTLSPFEGLALSGKRHLSATDAIRLGITIGLNNSESDRIDKTIENDTVSLFSEGTTAQSVNGQSIDIHAHYLFYTNPQEEVNLFLGSGLSVQYSRGYQEASGIEPRPPGLSSRAYHQSVENKKIGFGIVGLTGVEWFATKRLSLHAEHSIAISYEKSTYSETRKTLIGPPIEYSGRSVNEWTGKGWRVSSQGVKFGLSVYI